MRIEVRRARTEDFRGIHELRDIFVAFLQKLCPSYADAPEDWFSAPDFKKALKSRRHLWLVAEMPGRLIAYVHASVQDEDDGFKVAPYVEIVGIVVRPRFRRNGIAQMLLEEVESWARSQELSILRLVVHDANSAAVQLYEAMGYRCYMQMMEKGPLPPAREARGCSGAAEGARGRAPGAAARWGRMTES